MPAASTVATKPNDSMTTTAGPDCGCGPATLAPINEKIPDATLLAKLNQQLLWDKDGKEHSFKSVVQAPGTTRHLVLIIRRFICANCQEYIRELNWLLPRDKLPAGTTISIISNSSHEFTQSYINATSCSYDVYVDPDRKIYSLLELSTAKDLGPHPSYHKLSFAGVVLTGMFEALLGGKNLMGGGDGSTFQNGGEFLFVKDKKSDNWNVEWVHRMRSARDHTEIPKIMKRLGIEVPKDKPERQYRWFNFSDIFAWRSGMLRKA
jgi:hypothetical protein